MKKIITFLMVLALGLAATASAQSSKSSGSTTKASGMSEQSYYAMGLYTWAQANDPKLVGQLHTLIKATASVGDAAPDGSKTLTKDCKALMPLFPRWKTVCIRL